jgi:hypothetical protein
MRTRHMTRFGTAAMLLGAIAFSAGCSGDDGGPSTSPLTIAPTEDENGDSQVGIVGDALELPLRVIVTRDEEPVEDVEVQWITTTGGSFNPGTSLTGPDGIATTIWTLGPGAGDQTASARVVGAEGSPVSFSALAIDPPPGGGGGGGPEPLRRRVVR